MAGDLVGRHEELALIEAAYLGGDLSGVVVAGEAGVGKTHLARAFLTKAAGDGRATEWLAATDSLSHIPFGVFAHLVPPDAAATDPLGVFRAVRDELRARSPASRTVIGVDDAQLVDDGSAALVHHLASTQEAFVVVTVRTGMPMPAAILALWKDALAERVELQALSVDETGVLLVEMLGTEVEPATTHRLWDVTLGNPLFLRELVEVGRTSGALVTSEARWVWRGPLVVGGRLSELLRDRVVASTSEERNALELIAVGEPIDVAALAPLVSPDALAALEQRGLVALESSGVRRSIRLSHPLYGEALRAEIGELRAAQLRERLADAIEATGARRKGDLLRLATWRLESGSALDASFLLTAARQAAELRDHALAERLARAAVAHGGGAPAKVELGDALYWQDRFDEARGVLEECLETNPPDEDRGQVAIRLGSTHFFGFDDALAADTVLASVSEGLPAGGVRDETVAARATLAVYAGRTADALAMVAPILAQEVGDDCARSRALHAAVFAESVAGRPRRGQDLATAALPLAVRVSSHIPTAAGGIVIGGYIAQWITGDLASSVDVIEQLYLESLPVAVDASRGTWAHFAGHRQLVRGHAASAIRLLRVATSALAEQDPGRLLPWALGSLARAYVLIGDTARAQDAIEHSAAAELTAIQNYGPELRIARAWVAQAQGNPEVARLTAVAAADRARDLGQFGVEVLMLHDAVRLGALDVVDRLLEAATGVEGSFAVAIAEHVGALVADDAGRLEAAAEQFEEIGADLLGAEAWAGAAAAHTRDGLAARRLAAMTRAQACADRCEGARSEVLAGLDAPSELDTLTRREREIAVLAARGLSNPEIAERLVVSVRTVHNHVAHIFDKLGISRRSDLGPLFEPGPVCQGESIPEK